MTEFTVSHIELEDIDILAGKIQHLSKSMAIVTVDEFESLDCSNLHNDCFLIFNRSASEIREKLKEIENGKGAESAE